MDKSELDRLTKALMPKWSSYIPWSPTPKQTAFCLLDDIREMLYGGAAGGGKTVVLLMAAMQYVDVPGYSAIIIRKTFSDLIGPKAPMSLAQEWLSNTDAKWNRDEHTWKFPSGAKLKFGYIESDNDVYQYQGHEYQFIGIDELTQHSEFAYSYVTQSRLRKPDDIEHYPELRHVPLRIRCTSNPGGKYHDWVKNRFLDEPKNNPVLRKERLYMPAKLDDNPFINQVEYRKDLMKMPLVLREQLLNGNWEIRESGGFYKHEWVQLVDDYPHDAVLCRYWDLAATLAGDYTVGVLVAFKDGVYYVVDVQRMRATPLIVQNLVRTTAQMDGDHVHICMEQEPGSAGVNNIDFYAREVLPGYIFRADKKTGDKQTRAMVGSAAMEHGNLKFVKGHWNRQFIDELVVFPTGEHDDCVDGLSGAIFELNRIKSGMVFHVGNLDFDLVPRCVDRGFGAMGGNNYGRS